MIHEKLLGFVLTAMMLTRNPTEEFSSVNPFKQTEVSLDELLGRTRNRFHGHLCNNIDTHNIIIDILLLVHKMNCYFNSEEESGVNCMLVGKYLEYILDCLKLLGLDYEQDAIERKQSPQYLSLVGLVSGVRKRVIDVLYDRENSEQQTSLLEDVQLEAFSDIDRELDQICKQHDNNYAH